MGVLLEVVEAGKRYLLQRQSLEDVEPERDLLLSFGPLEVQSLPHRRATFLCFLVMCRILDRWGIPKFGPVSELKPTLEKIVGWIENGRELPLLEWARICNRDAEFLSGSEW